MTTQKAEHCMVCGSGLDRLENAEEQTCTYCARTAGASLKCPEGHFICDACKKAEPVVMIEGLVITTRIKNPFAVAELLMNHPTLPVIGCEHAFIAAGSLVAALKNSPYGGIDDREIREVFRRTALQAKTDSCGLTGVCSIAPAIGACFSLFLQAQSGSDREQRMVMESVIRVSTAIAGLTGPSCCKAYVRAALEEAVSIFGERFGMVLPGPASPVICRHQSKHPHGCREEKCPYYHYRKEKDLFRDAIHLPVTGCRS
jgi:hypothetical protein